MLQRKQAFLSTILYLLLASGGEENYEADFLRCVISYMTLLHIRKVEEEIKDVKYSFMTV
jgi:hypothetical protein